MNVFLAWKDRDLVRKGYPDFTIFYSAGKILRIGLARNLYDQSLQFRIQQEFAPDVMIRHGALPYNHPPFEALLFVPFTYLPYFAAYLAWNLLNVALLLLVLLLLRPQVPALSQKPLAVWLLISVAFFPIFVCLLQGQDILVLFFLLTLAYISLKKRQDFLAGCWLGIGTFRPHMVLPLAVIFLFARRQRSFFGFVASAVLMSAVSIAITGWQEFLHYPKYTWELEQVMGRGAIVPADMPNLRGFIDILFRDGQLLSLGLTFVASVAVLIATVRFFRSADRTGSLELAFSIAVLASVLVSYHAFIYDLSLLLLPVLFLINLALPKGKERRWTLTAPMALLFCTPLLMFLWLELGRLNYFVPVLLLWLWGMMRQISQLKHVDYRRAQSA